MEVHLLIFWNVSESTNGISCDVEDQIKVCCAIELHASMAADKAGDFEAQCVSNAVEGGMLGCTTTDDVDSRTLDSNPTATNREGPLMVTVPNYRPQENYL
jgi:hypothetical protein